MTDLGIYLIPSNLPLRERTRLVNVFPITLGPHGSKLDDVLACLEPSTKRLDRGVRMNISIGSIGASSFQEYFVSSFALGYLGDTPQQNENAGFLSCRALFGCRTCMVSAKQYDNLSYDIINYGRYHYEILAARSRAQSMLPTARIKYFQSLGMQDLPSTIQQRLSPCLDLVQSFPVDAPHACCGGLVRMAQDLLIDSILRPNEADGYSASFSSLQMPPGWPRIQNPIKHRGSWDLSEQARACVVTAVVLRIWLKDSRLRHQFVTAVKKEFKDQIISLGPNPAAAIVIKIFSQMATAYGYVTSHELNFQDRRRLQQNVLTARKMFVRLVSLCVPVIPHELSRPSTPTFDMATRVENKTSSHDGATSLKSTLNENGRYSSSSCLV